MALTEVGGTLVNFQVREPGDTDWLTLVCAENSTFEITSETTTRRTNCGTLKSVSDPEFNASGDAVQNATPTAAEASYALIKAYIKNKTKLEFRYISAADAAAGLDEGEGIFNYGLGYFVSVSATASAEENSLTFSWTFEGTGNLDSFNDES